MCAPQGYSADLLASALGKAGVSPSELLRLADPRHPPVQMKQDVLNTFSSYDEQLRAFVLPEPAAVASKRVVVTTCSAAGILRCGAYKRYHDVCKAGQPGLDPRLCGLEFSHVLVDEAGQVGQRWQPWIHASNSTDPGIKSIAGSCRLCFQKRSFPCHCDSPAAGKHCCAEIPSMPVLL